MQEFLLILFAALGSMAYILNFFVKRKVKNLEYQQKEQIIKEMKARESINEDIRKANPADIADRLSKWVHQR